MTTAQTTERVVIFPHFLAQNDINVLSLAWYGRRDETTEKSGTQRKKGIGITVGLDKLASLLFGVSAEVEGSYEATDSDEQTVVVKRDALSDAVAFLEEYHRNQYLDDLAVYGADPSAGAGELYRFHLPVRATVDRKFTWTDEQLYRVVGTGDGLRFTSRVQPRDFVSPTDLADLLTVDGGYDHHGIVLPQAAKASADATDVFGKLLFLYSAYSVPGPMASSTAKLLNAERTNTAWSALRTVGAQTTATSGGSGDGRSHGAVTVGEVFTDHDADDLGVVGSMTVDEMIERLAASSRDDDPGRVDTDTDIHVAGLSDALGVMDATGTDHIEYHLPSQTWLPMG